MAELGDVYQARMLCTQGTQLALNILHYRVSAKAGTGATDLQIAGTLASNFAIAYKATMSPQATWRGVEVQRVRPTLGLPTADITQLGVGTLGTVAAPSQVAGLLTTRTALGGRANRGRIYTAFPGESGNQSPGAPTGAFVALLVNLATQVLNTLTPGVAGNTNVIIPVVYHHLSGGTTDIIRVDARSQWGTQRRRGQIRRPDLVPF